MTLTPIQRDVLVTAIQVVRDLQVPDSVIGVQFGAARAEIAALGDRLNGAGDALGIQVTEADLPVVYLLLRSCLIVLHQMNHFMYEPVF
jgi:hypothetical protein